MPIEFVRIACLLALAACASAATCNNTVCSMNPPDSCMGYTYEYCFNATTSTGYNGQICYYSSDCASYTKTDGDFSVKLSGQPPNIIGMYYSLIKNAIRTAYNNFCTSGTNYKICCPGAVSCDLATISSSINIATVITSALSSQNVTVTVTVTTVGYSSSPANQVESSRFVVCATALMALVGFSLRRNL
uniref:Secreted protein n=1 Tax=Macrostomum lignano TaxID=282301 RepID=A0A1I8J6S8_9PLAT